MKKQMEKTYHLTKEETNNLNARRSFMGYIKDLVDRDVSLYLYQQVAVRLGLTKELEDKKNGLKLSDDGTTVILVQNGEVGKNTKGS